MESRRSGRNLRLGLVGETHDDTRVGTLKTSGAEPVPLVPGSIPCWEVAVQAATDNLQLVKVGNKRDGCHIELKAAGSISIRINDVSKIYVCDTDGPAQKVNWIAVI